MKRLVLCFVLLLVAQDRPVPPDAYCVNDHRAPKDHQCECHRVCVKNQVCDEEGENCEDAPGMAVREDPKCKMFCHKDHCGCDVKGCESTEILTHWIRG